MRALQYRPGYCRRRRKILLQAIVQLLAQKRLPRCADQNRHVQLAQLPQPSQNLIILVAALPKSQARVDDDLTPIHERLLRPIYAILEITQHRFARMRHVPQLCPRLWRAAHVVQNQTRVLCCHHVRHFRIQRQIRRVINKRYTILKRLLGHTTFVGIHGNRNLQLPFELFENRNQPAQLLRFAHRHRTRLRRLRADVNHVSALFFQLQRAGHRTIGITKPPPVGEAIGRDVQHAHNQCAVAELQLVTANFHQIPFWADHPCTFFHFLPNRNT